MKIACSLFLMFCFCSAELCAQEMVRQGWTVSEPRQRSASAISMMATGNAQDPLRSSPGTLISEVARPKDADDIRPPFPILAPKGIIYPRKAVRKGWEGQAVVAVEVLPDGSVGRMGLSRSSGHQILDEAAQSSIKTWKFAYPFEIQDEPPQYVDIPVTFKLESVD